MKKEFDFDDIGKKTPYLIPDVFFEEVQRKVMERTGISPQRKSHGRLIVSIVVAAAAVLAGFLFIPALLPTDTAIPSSSSSDALAVERTNGTTDSADKWIKELSDEELEEIIDFSENDIFLSNLINN